MEASPLAMKPSPIARLPRFIIPRHLGPLGIVRAALLCLGVVLAHGAKAQATVLYDAARDFSTNSNPNGVWSYGCGSYPSGYAYIERCDEWGNIGGLDFWRVHTSSDASGIYFNPTGDSVTNTAGTVVLASRQLCLQPGPRGGPFSLLRFEAPTNGVYRFVVSFQGVDPRRTDSDVHVYGAQMILREGLVNGFGPGTGPSFDFTLNMGPGTVVDFLAGGGGANNEYSQAATGISVQVLSADGAPPLLYSQPESRAVNAVTGSYITSVMVNGSEPFAYQWFFDGTPIAGATTSELSVPHVQPADAGTYFVVVSNAFGTVTSSNAVLTVLTYPPKFESQPVSVTAYQGETVGFTSRAGGTPPLAYQWFFNGAALPGMTNTVLSLAKVQDSQVGEYRCRVTNDYGSTVSSIAILNVLSSSTCVPVPAGAVAWWRGERNLWDDIGANDATPLSSIDTNSFVYVPYGAGKVGRTPRAGYSQNNPFLVVAPAEELDLGAGRGFTVEGWVKVTGYGSAPVLSWNDSRGYIGASLSIRRHGSPPPPPPP